MLTTLTTIRKLGKYLFLSRGKRVYNIRLTEKHGLVNNATGTVPSPVLPLLHQLHTKAEEKECLSIC